MTRPRIFAALPAAALLLSACAVTNDLAKVPEPMGRFLLGHAVAVADGPEVGPLSRKASDEAWEQAVKFALEERFGRYDGDKYFHISAVVEGYALAMTGVPIVATPKSVLIASVLVYDDEKGGKALTDEPEVFTVSEELSPDQLLGTGLTKTADEQMLSLARSLAKAIHAWMLKQPEAFGDPSLMDPATTSAGKPAATAGTVPAQFQRTTAETKADAEANEVKGPEDTDLIIETATPLPN
jgi:hypothetical protein